MTVSFVRVVVSFLIVYCGALYYLVMVNDGTMLL
jgi:hypothetical protein